MSEPLVFSVWIFSHSTDAYSAPPPRRLSLKHTQNSILLLVSHWSCCDFLLGLTLSLHPPSRASRLSVPDRRDLRTRTCKLREQIGVSIPLPSCLLLITIFAMISNNQGTPLEMKKPTSPLAVLSLRKATRKDACFISTVAAPLWVITELSKRRLLLGRLVASLIYQF